MYQSISKIPVLVMTVMAAADVAAHRAIDIDGTYTASGGSPLGTSDTKAYSGDELAVDVMGTTVCEAGAAIAAGAFLQVGSDGKYITKAAGKVVGRALVAATGDGSKFEALLLPATS